MTIKDIVIIRDGLPLLSKSLSGSETAFSRGDNIIMMSGFFSALESFSNNFNGLGSIRELKLDNKDMNLSFLRDPNLPNLIYLATYDDDSKGVNVQRFLRKISTNFLKLYNIEQILNWRGRKNAFEEFERYISQYMEEETEETEVDFKEKVNDLFLDVKERIDENHTKVINENTKANNNPEFYDYIPVSHIPKNLNLRHYLTGESSIKLIQQIDGQKSISQIARDTNLTPEKAYNYCKNLIKLGFITLSLTR